MLGRGGSSKGGLGTAGEQRVVAAIRAAETATSGEIRVHVDFRCPGDPMEAARRHFARLGMTATRERNGVLFYVALEDHRFAVVGDEGIHLHVGKAFWEEIRDRMAERFQAGDLAGGLEAAILAVGDRLREAFPRRSDDVNEIPDAVSSDEESPGPPRPGSP